jgi:hypothetical protein
MLNDPNNIPMAHAISVDNNEAQWTQQHQTPSILLPPQPPLAPPPAGMSFAQPPQYDTQYRLPHQPPPAAHLLPPPPPPLLTAARHILQEQGYTNGLIDALEKNRQAFPCSYWIVDNSGSMATADGHRIVPQKNGTLKFSTCTRWKEMQETVDYHTQLAAVLNSPTTYRLLNNPGAVAGPQIFRVAHSQHDNDVGGGHHHNNTIDHDLAVAQSVMMNAQPAGVTPLAQHVEIIRQEIVQMESQLRHTGGKVAIILATDGLPTDVRGYSNATVQGQFVETLRSLEGLPVWIVVRLCTDADDVVQYWNDLDEQLELSLEVLVRTYYYDRTCSAFLCSRVISYLFKHLTKLMFTYSLALPTLTHHYYLSQDDFVAEAEEVHQYNKWLNYALPLHRMRELGFYHKIFDLLDERQLAISDLKDFMKILFGNGPLAEAPDPEADWKGFCDVLAPLIAKEKVQWNPITKKLEPWIDLKKLKQSYGGNGSFFGMSFSFF